MVGLRGMSEPMLLIANDIRVDFEDARSHLALNSLTELADRNQVILFARHSQVVEQSGQVSGSVHVQKL
jgi:uncharacterized protein YhaN